MTLPRAVTQRRLLLGRADDVGEQHGRQDRLHGRAFRIDAYKTSNGVELRAHVPLDLVSCDRPASAGVDLDSGIGHQRGDVLGNFEVFTLALSNEQQRRNLDGREHSTDVRVPPHTR